MGAFTIHISTDKSDIHAYSYRLADTVKHILMEKFRKGFKNMSDICKNLEAKFRVMTDSTLDTTY